MGLFTNNFESVRYPDILANLIEIGAPKTQMTLGGFERYIPKEYREFRKKEEEQSMIKVKMSEESEKGE
jgi:hypothetical protein